MAGADSETHKPEARRDSVTDHKRERGEGREGERSARTPGCERRNVMRKKGRRYVIASCIRAVAASFLFGPSSYEGPGFYSQAASVWFFLLVLLQAAVEGEWKLRVSFQNMHGLPCSFLLFVVMGSVTASVSCRLYKVRYSIRLKISVSCRLYKVRYSLRPKISDVFYFYTSCLTIRLIQFFCVNNKINKSVLKYLKWYNKS